MLPVIRAKKYCRYPDLALSTDQRLIKTTTNRAVAAGGALVQLLGKRHNNALRSADVS
jgi:hypothetical protein